METTTAGSRRTLPPVPRPPVPVTARDTRPPVPHRPPVPGAAATRDDPGQLFVAALRAAAPGFAAAAGAATAVVAEAVPPARHRRAHCRLVLLAPDGAETEQVFVGAAGRPSAAAAVAFTAGIARWLRGDTVEEGGHGVPAAEVAVHLPG